jgi:hypothetical protein
MITTKKSPHTASERHRRGADNIIDIPVAKPGQHFRVNARKNPATPRQPFSQTPDAPARGIIFRARFTVNPNRSLGFGKEEAGAARHRDQIRHERRMRLDNREKNGWA